VGVVLVVVAAIPAARAQAPARLGEMIPVTVAALGFVTLISGALAVLWRRRWRMALIAFSLPVVALPLVGGPLLARVAAMRSSAGLARAIAAAGARAEVVGVGAFPPSLAFYLRRTIVLSTVDGHELTSNYVRTYFDELRRRSGTPLRDADWWRGQIDSCETPMVFVVRRQSEAAATLGRAGLPLIGTSRHYAAYGPCGAP
jgi:hypothetical protein